MQKEFRFSSAMPDGLRRRMEEIWCYGSTGSVQDIVQKRLLEGIRKYGAQEGSVVIMDPKTGGILGMAHYPAYDPGTFSTFDKSLYKNPIVASSFEPGSTFKALVMSAGIQGKQ